MRVESEGLRSFTRPEVVVSMCLGFGRVRWDGQECRCEYVEKFKPFMSFIPVCPELGIGLSVPRLPLRLLFQGERLKLVQPATGLDLTQKMEGFAEAFLKTHLEVDGFILKSGSPSCGLKKVKVYTCAGASKAAVRASGLFAALALQNLSRCAFTDEKDLAISKRREHFLTKLYTLASFRRVEKSCSTEELLKFHVENRLLISVYSAKQLRLLSTLIDNAEEKPWRWLVKSYRTHLLSAFKRSPVEASNIEVMRKLYNRFAHRLSKDESSLVLSQMREYVSGGAPLSVCLCLLKDLAVRFDENSLAQQSFLEPFPQDLMEIA